MNFKIKCREDVIVLFATIMICPLISFFIDLRYGRKKIKDFTLFHGLALFFVICAVILLIFFTK